MPIATNRRAAQEKNSRARAFL